MLKREYTILMVDKDKNIPYVWKGFDEIEGLAWIEAVKGKAKFQGLTPIRTSRLLLFEKPINHGKAVLWLNVILAIILVVKLLSL